MFKHLVVVAVSVLSIASVACHVGETTEITETYEAETTTTGIPVCNSPFIDIDLSKLKACGNKDQGSGHCYDGTKGLFNPDELVSPGCATGELCVPDKTLTAKGEKLKECKSFGGQAGVCTSLLQKELNENKAIVPQDVCDADERCAPCIDPRTGKDSGACLPQGTHEASCTGGKGVKIELCCHGKGTCVGKAGLPDGVGDDMNQDSCKDSSNVCAPTQLVNSEPPTKCDALGLSGVCLDTCFNDMLGGMKAALRGSCGPTEVCVPCVVGKGQGLPGCT